MARERKVLSLDQLYEFSSGLSKPRSEFGEGYPFLSFKDVFYNTFVPITLNELVKSSEAERERLSVKRGDVFLTRTSETMGELGMSCVALTDIPNATFNGFTKRLRPRSQKVVLPEYAGYFFRSPGFRSDVTAMSTLSTRASLNNEMLARLSIAIPPIAEQAAIGRILKALDDKIELNRRMNETLEAMTWALFKSWFVDFEPVRTKTERRDLSVNANSATDFPSTFVHSPLGDIPSGWRAGSVDEDFNLIMGQSPPGDTYNENGEGLPFYQGSTNFGVRFPTRRIYCTKPTRVAKAGDTLISVRAPVGDINMAAEDCAIGRGVAAARHKGGSRSYSYQFMRSINGIFSRFDAEGTVFGSIGKKDFHAIPCVIPPREIVSAYDRHVNALDDRVETNEREIRTLSVIRDSLLPKLISGELRVKDAERVAEAVA